MARNTTNEYRKIAREASKFAAMIADFERYGTGEFEKRHPDYGFAEGTDYIARKADELAALLKTYAADERYTRLGA